MMMENVNLQTGKNTLLKHAAEKVLFGNCSMVKVLHPRIKRSDEPMWKRLAQVHGVPAFAIAIRYLYPTHGLGPVAQYI